MQKGFTLVEVLVVMLIISIVGAASLLTISHNQNSRLENFAKQLTNIISLAEEQAMLQPAVLGLAFTPDTVEFFQYQEIPATKKSQWLPLTDSVFSVRRIPHNTQLSLKIQDEHFAAENSKDPQIIISPSGDLTPFVIYIGEKNSAPRFQVIGLEDGSVRHTRITNEK